MTDLIAMWAPVAGRAPPPSQRSLLVRELAWRLQARQQGGLDAATRRLLARAVRALGSTRDDPASDPNGGSDPSDANSEAPAQSRTARPPRRPHGEASVGRVLAVDLPTSARLVRVWPAGGGARHEVLVLEGGKAFEYRGRRYTSLTPIAREITGTHWSGPRFFGLTTRKGTHRKGPESAEEGTDMNGDARGT